MRGMYVASIRLENEWNAQNAISSLALRPSARRNLITRVLSIGHVKLKQSTTLEQNVWTFDRRRPHSSSLPNVWLLLVM